MAHFFFIARRPDGSIQRGSLDAATAEAARERLRKQGLEIEELQERKPAPQMLIEPPPRFAPAAPVAPQAPAAAMPAATPAAAVMEDDDEGGYVPLGETLRLFAGWLLAWYAVVYLFGSYQRQDKLPFELPFIDGMFTSPLILRFAFGTFMFLFFSSLHRWLGGGIFKGLLLILLWVIAFAFFHVNV